MPEWLFILTEIWSYVPFNNLFVIPPLCDSSIAVVRYQCELRISEMPKRLAYALKMTETVLNKSVKRRYSKTKSTILPVRDKPYDIYESHGMDYALLFQLTIIYK